MAIKKNQKVPIRPPEPKVGYSVTAQQWAQWRREAASPEYCAEAMKVIRLAGKVTRQAYLEAMLAMEEKHPGVGWKEQMDDLERFYHKYKLPLKDYPRMRDVPEVQKLLDELPF